MDDLTLVDIFSQESIKKRAKENWDFKDEKSKELSGRKYNHIFEKYNIPKSDWKNSFDELAKSQQRLLIKSEVIRTYDALPNIDKSKIKSKLSLKEFASKWYKLLSEDKKKILQSILGV